MSIVEFRKTSKQFGDLKVLDEVDLSIDIGEVVVLIGPSGSGKSTLLRCINGLEQITGGDLFMDGISVRAGKAQLRLIRQEAGMVFQQFNLFPQMTALENVAFGPRKVRGVSAAEARAQALALLEKVGLKDKAERYPSELSGGQQQRVAIARALAVKPKVMLFDEPTSALDPELKQEVLNVMRQLAQEGMTMIVVTHEMAFAKQVGTRLIFMEHGKISVDGPPREILENPPNERLRDFLQHVE
ncbi:glutamine transport system ATP-binding protein [Pseudochelatococcus lubricantis]|uniref:Glutamine transport system ATP-binding protein n=1 Tax=Pseudochelatococcus lubricantis TaxID=1538102 RepID=A0ABX0V0E0_9HYPH|nr:glutamine transport system ATP-binding protein [Pseudochelatococcus lubricantis]